MKRTLLTLLATSAVAPAVAYHEFFGGDYDGRGALPSAVNGAGPDAIVFEDARLAFSGGYYCGMWGLFKLTGGFGVRGVRYEVRRGVSAGNPGELLFQDTGDNVYLQATGFPDVFRVEGSNWDPFGRFPLNLGDGIFHIGMQLVGNGIGKAEIVTTDGRGGFGSPLGNGNTFFHSPGSGHNFSDVRALLGPGTWDFSIGPCDAYVPEPAGLAFLGIGLVGLALRRRTRF